MPCIRCGECAKVCPHELQPFEMYWFARPQLRQDAGIPPSSTASNAAAAASSARRASRWSITSVFEERNLARERERRSRLRRATATSSALARRARKAGEAESRRQRPPPVAKRPLCRPSPKPATAPPQRKTKIVLIDAKRDGGAPWPQKEQAHPVEPGKPHAEQRSADIAAIEAPGAWRSANRARHGRTPLAVMDDQLPFVRKAGQRAERHASRCCPVAGHRRLRLVLSAPIILVQIASRRRRRCWRGGHASAARRPPKALFLTDRRRHRLADRPDLSAHRAVVARRHRHLFAIVVVKHPTAGPARTRSIPRWSPSAWFDRRLIRR